MSADIHIPVRQVMAAKISPGILVLDDLTWAGGHVQQARDVAIDLGFRDLYPLGTGVVMRREHPSKREEIQP